MNSHPHLRDEWDNLEFKSYNWLIKVRGWRSILYVYAMCRIYACDVC